MKVNPHIVLDPTNKLHYIQKGMHILINKALKKYKNMNSILMYELAL